MVVPVRQVLIPAVRVIRVLAVHVTDRTLDWGMVKWYHSVL